MKLLKTKILIFAFFAIYMFFFSNDFGLIDVEKTSILTAIAIDYEQDQYVITAQIAVPEATDTNTENTKAQLSGKGSTVGHAIKDLGNLSGWFPKLSFCNLILIGDSLKDTNVIKVIDYFAKTLRVQDSALVAMSEGKASDLLSASTPLDNISAFAIQKVMLKNPGFDRDVANIDIKTFCVNHYSPSASSYMPIVKKVSSSSDTSNSGGSGSTSSGGQSGSTGNNSGSSSSAQSGSETNNLFDARQTALFKNGVMVGKLNKDQTFAFNTLKDSFEGTTIPINDIVDDNGNKSNYLLSVLYSTTSTGVDTKNDSIGFKINLDVYCKVSDHNAEDSNQSLSQNIPLPAQVSKKAEDYFFEQYQSLIQISKVTDCDFLKIKERLYRFHYNQYSRLNDDFLNNVYGYIKVNVHGQV